MIQILSNHHIMIDNIIVPIDLATGHNDKVLRVIKDPLSSFGGDMVETKKGRIVVETMDGVRCFDDKNQHQFDIDTQREGNIYSMTTLPVHKYEMFPAYFDGTHVIWKDLDGDNLNVARADAKEGGLVKSIASASYPDINRLLNIVEKESLIISIGSFQMQNVNHLSFSKDNAIAKIKEYFEDIKDINGFCDEQAKENVLSQVNDDSSLNTSIEIGHLWGSDDMNFTISKVAISPIKEPQISIKGIATLAPKGISLSEAVATLNQKNISQSISM